MEERQILQNLMYILQGVEGDYLKFAVSELTGLFVASVKDSYDSVYKSYLYYV